MSGTAAALISIPGYWKGVVGGGDVKLLFALALLWSPIQLMTSFSLGLLCLAIIMVAIDFRSSATITQGAPSSTINAEAKSTMHKGIPWGTALALGATITTVVDIFAP